MTSFSYSLEQAFDDDLLACESVRILDEEPKDVAAREWLLDEVFGDARFAKTCERLREGRRPARGLSLVAKAGHELVGTMRFWHILAGDAGPALLLGPLGVAASHRSRGIGGRLIAEGLFRAVMGGHRAVLLIGDAPYYARFGFGRSSTRGLVMPGPVDPERFLGLELTEEALLHACGDVIATGAVDLRPKTVAPFGIRPAA
jgi:predicted N-acetyltransferase YhbS